MADTPAAAPTIWDWKGRPCITSGEVRRERPRIGGKWRGHYQVVQIRFVDGLEPRLGEIGKITWGKVAKQIRGAQREFWRRVDDLVEGDGLTAARARQQAMAEQAKGIGSNPE